jgi:glycosyltransferase involved in cell wall biosynthesis
VVDGLLVYDDGSQDRSPDIAASEGAVVVRRPGNVPSWAESEAACREAAWRCLHTFSPDLGDWIISVDADEFVMTPYPDRRKVIQETMEAANEESAFTISLRVHEIFGWQGDQPMVRIDGYWGNITGIRMMRWGFPLNFDREGPARSVPGKKHRVLAAADKFSLVHMGYAREADRKEKFERYSAMPGHNPAHVKSILKKGKLVEWAGELPCGPS